MMRNLPFSVNHYLCPHPMDLVTFLDRLRSEGFTGVGLTEAALRSLPLSVIKQELSARGLALTSLNTAGFFLQEGDAARAQELRNATLLQQAAECQGALNVIVGGSSSLPLTDARELAADRLALFAREARDMGVQLIVEPLHPMNVRTKSCFNTIRQMEVLFDRIPDLTLNADLFHLWWDPDLERLLSGASIPIGLFQICDIAIPEGELIPRRVPLGEGFVPWSDYINIARKAFPLAPIELELFADQLPGRNLEALLSESASMLTTLGEDK